MKYFIKENPTGKFWIILEKEKNPKKGDFLTSQSSDPIVSYIRLESRSGFIGNLPYANLSALISRSQELTEKQFVDWIQKKLGLDEQISSEIAAKVKSKVEKENAGNIMGIDEALDILKKYNRWRRTGEMDQPDPTSIGIAIDTLIDFHEK